MMDKAELIPEAKLREACAKCMQHAKHARYFNEAPPGAKQYIALVFFETVFPNDLTEEVSEQCFKEMLHELNADDLLYLIAHETDSRTRDVFVERLAYLREEAVLQRRQAENPASPREQPSAQRMEEPVKQVSVPRGVDSVYKFIYNARKLDQSVAAWKTTWIMVCVSFALVFFAALVYVAIGYAIIKGWLRI